MDRIKKKWCFVNSVVPSASTSNVDVICESLSRVANSNKRITLGQLGFNQITDRSEIGDLGSFILRNLSNPSDRRLKDPKFRSKITKDFQKICTRINGPKDKRFVLQKVAALSTALTSQAKLQLLIDSASSQKVDKLASSLEDKIKKTTDMFEHGIKNIDRLKDQNGASMLRCQEQLKKRLEANDVSLADSNLYIRLLHKIGEINKIRTGKFTSIKRLQEFYKIQRSILKIQAEIQPGFLSELKVQASLQLIDMVMQDEFIKNFFSNTVPNPAFSDKYYLFPTSRKLTDEERYDRAYQGFLNENGLSLQRVPSKPVKKSQPPAPDSKIDDRSIPFESIPDGDETPGVDDDCKVEMAVPEAFKEEAPSLGKPFPYAYANRVLRWNKASIGSPLPSKLFPEYDPQCPDTVILFHRFSPLVDSFYDSGLTEVWKNKTTGEDDTLYLIPAQIKLDQEVIPGTIAYCIGKADGVCYHRYFQPMSTPQLFETFGRAVFSDQDFPELGTKVESIADVPVNVDVNKDTIDVSKNGAHVTIFDATNNMKITLTLLNV